MTRSTTGRAPDVSKVERGAAPTTASAGEVPPEDAAAVVAVARSGRGQEQDRAAAAALKAALLRLIDEDEEVRGAIREAVLPARRGESAGGGGPAGSDAERAGFVVDLIESHLPRLVRGDALRRPAGR